MDTSIKKVSIKNAEALCVLSKEIYTQHYLHLWNKGGAEWYMHEYAYAIQKISNELKNKHIAYYFLYNQHQPIGYLKLNFEEAFINAIKVAEIERIYLYKEFTGKGYGTTLMQFAIDTILKKGYKTIILKAMDSSMKAIKFYKKIGFNITGTTQLPLPTFKLMKKKFRGMVIMQKTLN